MAILARVGLFVLFVFLFGIYYTFDFQTDQIDSTFLSISTFLFSIFSGFFIARQGARYSKIRESMAAFDGNLSTIYRGAGHLEPGAQEEVAEILKHHYRPIIDHHQWDYNFTHKTSTITDTHDMLEKFGNRENARTTESRVVSTILGQLANAQQHRKTMVALHQEHIPLMQWILVYLLAGILLLTLSVTVESHMSYLGSALKGVFGISITAVVIILHMLDRLYFFSGSVGENSAQDVLHIIEGVR